MSGGMRFFGIAVLGSLLVLGAFVWKDAPLEPASGSDGVPGSREPSSVRRDSGIHLSTSGTAPAQSAGPGPESSPYEGVLEGAVAELMEHDPRAPVVLGAFLDRKTSYELRTPRGMERFLGQFSGLHDFTRPIQEVQEFWKQMEGRDLQEREALLRVTDGVIRASGDDSLKERLLSEFDGNFHVPPGQSAGNRVDYGEKALQLYLSHASSTPGWEEEMQKRGIPVLFIPPRETEVSPGESQELHENLPQSDQ